ncbi:MAG TPA: epoxide hydrolase [Armatimonadota bacterium]
MQRQPFTIDIAQATLNDLDERLARTRWLDAVPQTDWDAGTNPEYLQSLVAYWQRQYDWRAQEALLNRFTQYRAEIDGLGIHFIYEQGLGPHPLPLIYTHGWPGSFYEMYKIIPLLSDPAHHGGDPADAFDVIIPSLPGFGFSDIPRERGMTLQRTADLWARLMTDVLGYRQFVAGGGDFGSGVTRYLAIAHPELLIGIHLTYLGYPIDPGDQSDLSAAEQQYRKAVQEWVMREGAYAMIQSTKPQTLAFGLNDSPVGLAAWLAEKYRAWSDCDGDIERSFTKDELLTNVMIYWATGTINSSIRTYYENGHLPSALQPGQHIEVPAGIALFPKDINLPTREWAERSLRVQRWTEMPRGGHFAALEEPELLVEDIRAFFRPFRAST